MKRREAISVGLGAAFGIACGSRLPAAGSRLDRIGLQLYTLREEMRRNVERTLQQVAEIGFREVEFAGYFERTPRALHRTLDQFGLTAPAAHVPITALEPRSWAQTLDAARELGHRYLIVAWIDQAQRTVEGLRAVATLFNRAGREARTAGLQFAYHNHDFEFAAVEGQLLYDFLLAETDPDLVQMELDLYWITKGGGDPLAYFAKYPGRFPLVHVKDSAGPPAHLMVDVGAGRIDWRRIFANRQQAGIRHFFVEHDQPADPYASVRNSYRYLRQLEF